MQGAVHRARVRGLWHDPGRSVVVRLDAPAIRSNASTFAELWLNHSYAAGEFATELVWAGKTPTRLPESAWLELRPALPAGDWALTVDKLGTAVDVRHVVERGGRRLHAVSPGGALRWTAAGRGASLWVEPIDSALVAPGLANTNLWRWDGAADPHPADGAAFNLHNNLYPTNYPLWTWRDRNARFRFRWGIG